MQIIQSFKMWLICGLYAVYMQFKSSLLYIQIEFTMPTDSIHIAIHHNKKRLPFWNDRRIFSKSSILILE